MATATAGRFLTAGLHFFGGAFVSGLVLLAAAPLDVVRLLCVFALACAAAGFALHLVAMRSAQPGAWAALKARTQMRVSRFAHLFRGTLNTTHEATDTVWPCVIH